MNMIELFNRVKHIVQRYGKLEQCNLIPNCTGKGQLCTCHYGAAGGGGVNAAVPSPLKTHLSADIILDDKLR